MRYNWHKHALNWNYQTEHDRRVEREAWLEEQKRLCREGDTLRRTLEGKRVLECQ